MVDVDAWLNARREEMREEAESEGLSLHDALVYYGDYGLLWEVIRDELFPTDEDARAFADAMRDDLMCDLRQLFVDGKLIAYAGDPKRPGYRIKIPREEWSVLEWRDTSSLSSYGFSLTDWLCRPVSRLGGFYGDAECYHNVTVKSVDNDITSSVSAMQEHVANETVASEPAVYGQEDIGLASKAPEAVSVKGLLRKWTDEKLIEAAVDEEECRNQQGLPPFKSAERLAFLKEKRPELTANYLKERLLPEIRKLAQKRGLRLRGRGDSRK